MQAMRCVRPVGAHIFLKKFQLRSQIAIRLANERQQQSLARLEIHTQVSMIAWSSNILPLTVLADVLRS